MTIIILQVSVSKEIKKASARLAQGLTWYKLPSETSKASLKQLIVVDAKSTKQQTMFDFIAELASFLVSHSSHSYCASDTAQEVDEMQTFSIFQKFMFEVMVEVRTDDLHEFVISKVSDAAKRTGFIDQILEYYHSERLYLLYCQKHLLALYDQQFAKGWDEYIDPYHEGVESMLAGNMSDNDVKKVKDYELQSAVMRSSFLSFNLLDGVLKARLEGMSHVSKIVPVKKPQSKLFAELNIQPTKIAAAESTAKPVDKIKMLTPQQMGAWAVQILKERREIISIVLLYSLTMELTASDKASIISIIDSPLLVYRAELERNHVFDICKYNFEQIIAKIRFSQVMLFFELCQLH